MAVDRAPLIAAGYIVENMEEEWGREWAGQWRFLRGDDDIGAVQYSEEDAWADAEQYHKQLEELGMV